MIRLGVSVSCAYKLGYMQRKTRLIFLSIFLGLLIVVGRTVIGNWGFILGQQFWFASGLFLLILLSLVDQPHFSKDANIFVNATTGLASLLLVGLEQRDVFWWAFLFLCLYLIVSSYALMWIREKILAEEGKNIQLLSRINREIGRPEALFSAFFVWGCIRQFGLPSLQANALLVYWMAFLILNLPAIAKAIDDLLNNRGKVVKSASGVLLKIISPRIAEVALSPDLETSIVGAMAVLENARQSVVAEAIIIDDRILSGKRIGKFAILKYGPAWTTLSADAAETISIKLIKDSKVADVPISVADVGSEIGTMVFYVHPDISLQEGEVVWVELPNKAKAYYQIVSGQISLEALPEGNSSHTVKVSAGQLGTWNTEKYRFEPITWVPPAARLVYTARGLKCEAEIPAGHLPVGVVPNSDFPVHVDAQDIVTHNTAIIGVTGSGKSYLAFHLIEGLIKSGIRVMVLDISRQYYLFLEKLNPYALKEPKEVEKWFSGDQMLAIHQYALTSNFPATTAEFVEAAFKEVSKIALKAGVTVPAKLCVVLEEAHSLIPEWNQVANPSDSQYVNRTARTILQGRKYGMGCLLVTQRTANVTKTILNQCNTIFALQSFDQTGLDFLKNYMGEAYSHAISTLPVRHSILVGKASSSLRPILFKIDDFSVRWYNAESSGSPVSSEDPKTL